MEDLEGLGKRVAELRDARGLTAAEAARRAGMTDGSYWIQIEHATPNGQTGRPTRPRPRMVRAIADALGADRVELLLLAGHEPAEEDRSTVGHWLDVLELLDPETRSRIEWLAEAALTHALDAPPTDEMADPAELARLVEAGRESLAHEFRHSVTARPDQRGRS